MNIANNWQDYEILDMANGEKLERWGNIYLIRPDPQIIWKEKTYPEKWKEVNARYNRSSSGGGNWQKYKKIPEVWQVKYKNLTFNIKPMGFKHTGLFPEQAVNWQFIIDKIKEKKSSTHENREIKALNLFAYTGGATAACAYAGCDEVVHVDASKKIVSHAKTNIEINNLHQKKVRFIIEDVIKFVLREVRRERKYDVIIMDPPVYGRGPNGELWQIETSLKRLVEECVKLLSDSPILFLINCYTASFSHISLKNILSSYIKNKGTFESGEIGLPIENSDMILPCGIYARFYS